MSRRCAVVGAGIVGAGVADALARRGWSVTVLEQEPHAAGATSGLPVALAVPQPSADDAPRSRLVRLGLERLHQHARRHLVEGQDWAPSGVLERRSQATDRWHATGLWIRPARLANAWLTQSGITLVARSCITELRHTGTGWDLVAADGRTWQGFDAVVLANALGCRALLRDVSAAAQIDANWMTHILSLQAVHGLLSHGQYPEPWPNLPTHPINGKGCFVPAIPDDPAPRWALGSTFVTDALLAADIGTQHAENLARLRVLLPEGGDALAAMLDRGKNEVWSGTRCTTRDRLPLVGQVPGAHTHGLWLCTGMGSRGMSLVGLCAEWLAACMQGDDPAAVLDPSLARYIDTQRWRHKPATPSVADSPPGAG